MKRYYILAFAVCVTMPAIETRAIETQAMPVVAPIVAPPLSILVASGCGLGVHRGPFDGCETVYDGNHAGAGRFPGNHYYVGFNRGGLCGGRGTHLDCNRFGQCRVVCN
jgi:hypothetical protein